MVRPSPLILSAAATLGLLALVLASLGPIRVADASPLPEFESRGAAAPDLHMPAPTGTDASAGLPDGTEADDAVSYAEPSEVLLAAMARRALGDGASQAEIEAASETLLAEWGRARYHGPDPDDHARLLRGEQRALAAGSSPQAMGLAVSGTLRLLVVAVEFAGSDAVEDFSHPKSMTDRECITETRTFTGPLHGQIPPPGPRDNNTLWLPDFDPSYYEAILFSTDGVTERVRTDLVDPEDGLPGIDISGQTMQRFYDEASGGRVRLEPGPAGTIAWLQVPHSEAYYGASRCNDGQAPDIAAMHGLPSNPMSGFGPRQLIIDMADAINAQYPDFPWTEYDTDGNGVIDHVIAFHAGKDKSNGGGEQSWQAIWAHRGSVNHVVDDGGTPDDDSDDVRLRGYTMQYEDGEPGVVIHEFGHDLGLPDLYDTSRGGRNSTEHWDAMGAGGRLGKLNSTHPIQLSTWTRFALGWADPTVITPTETAQEITLGQITGPPPGTADAARVNLPPIPVVETTLPAGSSQAWWSNDDQNWADVRLSRDLDLVAATAPISISFDLKANIQTNRDYLFLEVSDDDGQTFTQIPGFAEGTDTELTIPDTNFEDMMHGYTGNSGQWLDNEDGWLRVYHPLSTYAGRAITLRLRYVTDSRRRSAGAYVDNISVTDGAGVLFEDAVENDDPNDWITDVKSIQGGQLGDGWQMSTGVTYVPHYYLLEWRNFHGFDKGMRYTYNTVFSHLTDDGRSERHVDYLPNNAPGMVLWYRDLRFGSEPNGTNNGILTDARLLATPSEGPKGGVLVVDAHPEPLRGPRGGQLEPVDSESGETYGPYPFPPFDNWSGRVQTTNAAFGLGATAGVTLTVAEGEEDPATTVLTPTYYAPLPAVPAFHDALGYYPGVEVLPEPIKTLSSTTTLRLKAYALADPDAGVVIPAKGYYPPRTPPGFTGQGAETSPPSDSVSTYETLYNFDKTPELLNIGQVGGIDVSGLHSGHPGSSNLQFGHHFEVVGQADDGSSGVVRLWNSPYEVEVGGALTPAGGDGARRLVAASARNVGGPSLMALISDFDERAAAYVPGSATGGALPVKADLATILAALEASGLAGLTEYIDDSEAATAVVLTWDEPQDTGTRAEFTYALTQQPGRLEVVNHGVVHDTTRQTELEYRYGHTIFLPQAKRGVE